MGSNHYQCDGSLFVCAAIAEAHNHLYAVVVPLADT
jgi:hypothetical protein